MCSKLPKHWEAKWQNLIRHVWHQLFEYETLWQVLVSIWLFRTNSLLTAAVVVVRASITSPIMVSNVSRQLWCAFLISVLKWQVRICCPFASVNQKIQIQVGISFDNFFPKTGNESILLSLFWNSIHQCDVKCFSSVKQLECSQVQNR